MAWFDTGWFATPGWFMPYNITDIVKAALRSIGAIATGETLTDAELMDGTEALNLLASMWSAKGMPVYAATQEDLTLTVNKASYSIGNGATPDFTTGRPMKVLASSYIRDSGGNDTPIEIIGKQRYNRFSVKTAPGLPQYLFYDSLFENGYIYLYPAPNTAYTLHLASIKPLNQFSDPTQSFALPPEYYAAFKWNLAIDLAPEYEKQASATIIARAKESYNAVVNLNCSNMVEPVAPSYPATGSGGGTMLGFG